VLLQTEKLELYRDMPLIRRLDAVIGKARERKLALENPDGLLRSNSDDGA
jgi:hypothetical protein